MTSVGVSLRDVVARTINISGIHVGLADEELIERLVGQLVAALDASGVLAASELAGLQRRTVVGLAVRLRPDVFGFEQAITELERAVEIALEVIARGERGADEDAFINDVLARVANRIRQDDLEGGVEAIDSALAELEVQRQEFEATQQRKEVLLLEEGVRVDTLRRDADRVAQRLERIVALDNPGVDRPAWHPDFRAWYDAYKGDGERKGIGFSLAVAIELARRMLATAHSIDERGRARNNLGNTLWMLGQREAGTEHLLESVQTLRAALKERTRERVPLAWAMTQNNLGNALSTLGQREAGRERLKEAVQAYRAALDVHTRECVPLDWATIQSNFANALSTLGQREAGTERLKEAVQAFRDALEVHTRELAPFDWAITQSNFGSALAILGEREDGTRCLLEAIQAYRAALDVHTREFVPLVWAMTHNNLGNALRTLGQRETSTARLEEAVQAFRYALEVHTRERVPLDWAMTQNNLGTALTTLGKYENSIERLQDAVKAYYDALKEWTRERAPFNWAETQNNLGIALHALGQRQTNTKYLRDAVEAYDLCLQIADKSWLPIQIEELHARRNQVQLELDRQRDLGKDSTS